MARRSTPDMIALNARVPRGTEAYWALMRKRDALGPWSIADIDADTNGDRDCVRNYVRRLRKGGFVRVAGARDGAHLYRLAKKPVAAPRLTPAGRELPPTAQQRMWTAMRALKIVTITDLQFHATVDGDRPQAATVIRYVNRLRAAGYLVSDAGAYRLKPAMNSGPRAPHVLAVRVLYDPNWRKAVTGAAPLVAEPSS